MKLSIALVFIFNAVTVSLSSRQKSCSFPSATGDPQCDDYSIKYFFHTEFGECSKFWYGGCGGNDNRFDTMEECISTCVSPRGSAICDLPSVRGPCTQNYTMYYYNHESQQCHYFNYSGCLGNANRFESYEECQNLCVNRRIQEKEEKEEENVYEIQPTNLPLSITTTTRANAPSRSQCRDNNNFADCGEAVRANLCHNAYYKRFCCVSCRRAGF